MIKPVILPLLLLLGQDLLNITEGASIKDLLEASRDCSRSPVHCAHLREQKQDIDESSSSDVEELYFTQRLDHFGSHPSNDDIVPYEFRQRYFYTARYVHTNVTEHSDYDHDHNHDSTISTSDHRVRQLLRKNTHWDLKEDELVLKPSSPIPIPSSKGGKKTKPTLAFVCMGGEGPALTKSVLVDSVHCTGDMIELATILYRERGFNVHLFALEHRYYGSSFPKAASTTNGTSSHASNSTTVVNMSFLSSRQALADLAYFIPQMTTHYTLKKDDHTVRWITFGGSYPGMLAAWARLKLPHLVYASISNSAPVQVTLDFARYNEKVGEALHNPDVGGSDACYDIVVKGHEAASLLLSQYDKEDGFGRDKIDTLFGVCGGADSLKVERNVQAFLGDGVVNFPVQGNNPACVGELCNIKKICTFLTSSKDPPLETLAKLSKQQSPGCKNIDWSQMITYLSSDQAKANGDCSWLWQTCTEMGFYQTCHLNSTCPYGKGYHSVDLDLEICKRVFGIDADRVARNVQDTLDYYGGWDMKATRILSVNGKVDPWSALSLNVKKDSHTGDHDQTALPTLWSNEASHHFWTHKILKSDGVGIMQTRESIFGWIIDLMDAEQIVSGAH